MKPTIPLKLVRLPAQLLARTQAVLLDLNSRWGRATAPPSPHLRLVSEDVNDGTSLGRSWRGTPFQFGDRVYRHGLAFNANNRLQLHLSTAGERFMADVGLENNDDTRRGAAGGSGSVTYHAAPFGG